MTGRFSSGAWTVAGAAWLLTTASPAGQDRPMFRAATSTVSVNVSVKKGNQPLLGLGADDFDVTDNGVPQKVDDVSRDAVPIDATLMVDTSGSTAGIVPRLKSDANQIIALLRPIDRFRLLTFDRYVNELAPMQPTDAPRPAPYGTDPGGTSAYDALIASMIARRELDRRQLIVAMTDGIDTISALQAPMLIRVAARSEAVLHVVLVGSNPGSHNNWPASIPHRDFNEPALREATARTGGELHSGALSDTPVEAFKKILDDYRQSYILHFTPAGVPRAGWHDLTVTLKRPGKFTIRARKGYDGGSSNVDVQRVAANPIG